MLGFLVIAERYLPDLVAWISLITNDEHYLERIDARFLLALASKVQVKVYVTAHFKKLLIKRSNGIDPYFVGSQLKLYERIVKTINAQKLDTTSRSIDDSLSEIFKILNASRYPRYQTALMSGKG